MYYRFIMTFTPTDGESDESRLCCPIYSNDLALSIDKEGDEWYYKRSLEGKLTFLRDDYQYIMGCDFDGVFKLAIEYTIDLGATWHTYFEGSFSRANLEIDEDNQSAVLDGLSGSAYKSIENGKGTEYDLMKLIPDSEAKEVQGQVHPALALVDYRSSAISQSDMYCGGALVAGGYDSNHPDSGFSEDAEVVSDSRWLYVGVYAEASITMEDSSSSVNGRYCGTLQYSTRWMDFRFPVGTLTSENGSRIVIDAWVDIDYPSSPTSYRRIRIYDENSTQIAEELTALGEVKRSPSSIVYDYSDDTSHAYQKMEIIFHYIRASLLTQSGGNDSNLLDTGDYYKFMSAFEGSGLAVSISGRTVEQPNGHRLVPGTGEQGENPQYFAEPDETYDWIPLAEDNWNFASLWYRITPSVENGLTDPDKVGSFRWTRCWTVGTCLRYLLKKITNDEVYFDESAAGSQFLYSSENPVANHEHFDYLVTQKSNVMRPSNTGAARCTVTLAWFLELLRNAFNCYWWLEEQNDGRYSMRIEHVEYFRRGGSYSGTLESQIDLTEIKTRRNFLRGSAAAKRLSDGINRYGYDLKNMVEQYTFSWQGDGGSDDFKGNPMFFKAGWIEKGSTENHEVDNIFADLSWLMLNAGTSAASSKNYDGLFLFGTYQGTNAGFTENSYLSSQYFTLARGLVISVNEDIWVTIPVGQTVTVELIQVLSSTPMIYGTYTGTGEPQLISVQVRNTFSDLYVLRLNGGSGYANVMMLRIHDNSSSVYQVANTENLLNSGSFLQNGALSWPWLQNEFIHYDIPAAKWSFDSDDIAEANFLTTGTVKLVKKQSVGVLPLPTKDDESLLSRGIKGGLKDGNGDLLTGIMESAKVNLTSRNCELTIMYDIIS